jgi:hypothetical protein
MATMQVNSLILRCDGCGTALLDGQRFASAMDARGAAYGEGWRFPAQLSKRTGAPVSNCSDACPKCLPDWTPQVLGARSGYERKDHSTT